MLGCVIVCAAFTGSSSSYRSPGQASSSRMAQMASPVTRSSYTPVSQMRMVLGVDVAPPGCAPNAYKLFVGNIPRAYTEPDLLPVSACPRACHFRAVNFGQLAVLGVARSFHDTLHVDLERLSVQQGRLLLLA